MESSTSVTTFFSPDYMDLFFKQNLLEKSGGGRDRITPETFYRANKDSLPLIIDKCLNGTYNFSSYSEKLLLKGRDRYPRVISIPTVRDRWVLGVLAKYLQSLFPECVCHDLPNMFIYKIQQFIEESKNKPIFFFQTDIESFYDAINHDLLLGKLNKRVNNKAILSLIEKAIKNPTVSSTASKTKNLLGVPQGLAISNILAHIYVHDIDIALQNEAFSYFRYVDDILCLGNKKTHLNKSFIGKLLKEHGLGLKLSQTKTRKGDLREDQIDYLGYLINADMISIRKKNIDKYLNRLAAKCTIFSDSYENPMKRPRYMIDNDSLFIETFCHELNLMICGAKYKSKMYGWLPYFRQMNDVALLHRFDKIVDKMLRRIKCFSNERPTAIRRFVSAYYRFKHNNGVGAVFDYNNITSIGEKVAYLKKHGQLDNSKSYSQEQIETIFHKYMGRNLTYLDQDIGFVY